MDFQTFVIKFVYISLIFYLLCIDIFENRLSIATTLGAKSSICVKNMDIEAVMKEVTTSLGGQPDITLECSGAESSVRLGMKVSK